MTIPALTASALWRGELCPGSLVLPATPRRYKDQDKGNAAHKKLEESAPEGSIPEAAFALNVISGEGRFLGSKIEREYGELHEGEIAGTIDLLTVEADRVCVDDYKSGVGYRQAPPRENPQLQHGAIAAASVARKDAAKVSLIYLKTGEVKDAEYDAIDLGAALHRLKGIYMRTKAAQAALALGGPQALIDNALLQLGDACWRCPAEKSCPLKGQTK